MPPLGQKASAFMRKKGEIHVDSTDPLKLRPLFPFLAPKMAIWIKAASAPPQGDLGKDGGGQTWPLKAAAPARLTLEPADAVEAL